MKCAAVSSALMAREGRWDAGHYLEGKSSDVIRAEQAVQYHKDRLAGAEEHLEEVRRQDAEFNAQLQERVRDGEIRPLG